MVADSVARYVPAVTLADAACAVILRDSVGFANAAAIHVSFGSGDTTWMVIPVVGPAQAHLVRPRQYDRREAKQERWADVFAILESDFRSPNDLQHAEVMFGGATELWGRPVAQSTLALREAIRGHDAPEDFALARTTLLSDSSLENRTVAAFVLSNFPERDERYHLLAEGLRGFDSGTAIAGMVLTALARSELARPVDWAPARAALEALAGGTNLFAYGEVLEALVATEVDRQPGVDLARVNPGLLLDHVGARNPLSRGAAHRFLVHVAGEDLGRDREAWKGWLRERRKGGASRPARNAAPRRFRGNAAQPALAMLSRKSWLVSTRRIRSSRKSSASAAGMSPRKLRNR
jgi:hypothetical protein